MADFQVSMVHDEHAISAPTVLKIASASQNSQSQFYPDPVRVSRAALGDLNRKLREKLSLHQVTDTRLDASIKLTNNRSITFTDVDGLVNVDTEIDALTSLVTLKWQFLFCQQGKEHLHSVYVRIAEKPNPAMLFHKAMTLSMDDLESFDKESMAPVTCRVDFLDGRFSTELLAVVSEWVASLPKAEPTFGLVKWLDAHEHDIGEYVVNFTPAIWLAASIGIWLGVLSPENSQTVRSAVAWILFTGLMFFFVRYTSLTLMRWFARNITRMNAEPPRLSWRPVGLSQASAMES
jgi:hypothetical protein